MASSDEPHGYLPLPDYVTIKKSPIHGLGLFAAKDIPAGTELGITHVADRKKGRFPNDSIRTPLGGFINHSKQPNTDFVEEDDAFRLKVSRDIRAGEELTTEYGSWDWYDQAVIDQFN
jgi:SET domain-containing protein